MRRGHSNRSPLENANCIRRVEGSGAASWIAAKSRDPGAGGGPSGERANRGDFPVEEPSIVSVFSPMHTTVRPFQCARRMPHCWQKCVAMWLPDREALSDIMPENGTNSPLTTVRSAGLTRCVITSATIHMSFAGYLRRMRVRHDCFGDVMTCWALDAFGHEAKAVQSRSAGCLNRRLLSVCTHTERPSHR
jgi:hypothetical protein